MPRYILSTYRNMYLYVDVSCHLKIEQIRDDLSKKSQLETHKKINEEMKQNLEQLKQEKAQLQLSLEERENHRNAQVLNFFFLAEC